MTQSPVPDIAIDAALDRADGAYLHQQSIRLVIALRNQGGQPRSIPYLVAHSIAFDLRDAGGQARRAVRAFKAPPPLMNMPEPEVDLQPGEAVSYRLLLEPVLGPIAPGSYGLRLLVEAGPLPFTTPWLPFTVAPSHPAAPATAPSAVGEAFEERTAWRDDGVRPPQILLRTRATVGRGLPPETRPLGEADAASEPAVASSPGEASRIPAWVAWVAGGNLVLARQYVEEITLHRHPLPAGRFQAVNPFGFSEQPDGSETRLQGVLLDGETGRLVAFSGDGPQVAFSAPTTPGAHRIDRITSAVIDRDRIGAVVTRVVGDRTQFEGWVFKGAEAPAGPVALGALDGGIAGVAAAYEFHEQDGSGRVHWSGWESPGRTTSVRVVEGVWNLGDGVTARSAAPRVRNVPIDPGTARCDGALDLHRRLWLLSSGGGSAKVFGPDFEDGVPITLRPGGVFETLIFRRGVMPQVMALDPVRGFDATPVDLEGPPPPEPPDVPEDDE